eukprot:GGOE01058387.1.p2 GENE.GGOE01058387.1~~GGOE01058387.1.p2  ORF type:complete len:111 (+),score=1.15 GGOE01058387.1:281-613(+)
MRIGTPLWREEERGAGGIDSQRPGWEAMQISSWFRLIFAALGGRIPQPSKGRSAGSADNHRIHSPSRHSSTHATSSVQSSQGWSSTLKQSFSSGSKENDWLNAELDEEEG